MRQVSKPEEPGKGDGTPALTKLRTRDELTGELRPLTAIEAAPLIACLKAPGAGYAEIDVETYMVLAWCCFIWERTGAIPTSAPPLIDFSPCDVNARPGRP